MLNLRESSIKGGRKGYLCSVLKMKKLLVLGAGIYQVPLIKKIKEMGIYCIVSSICGNYPGFQYADKVYYENTTDAEAILKIARAEQIDGILTTGTDVAVITIGYVCEQMGLNGISYKSAQCTTNKAKMKESLLAGGVKTGKFQIVHTIAEAYRCVGELGFPVMFRCVDKSGSRGIIKVEREDQITEAFNFSLSYSNCDYIVIEKFLEGYEIGIDGYVSGKHRVILPHGKVVHFNGKTKVPVGHVYPFECSEALHRDITEQINKAIDALNLDQCFFNVDAMIDGDECYLIEIGGRTGATCIPELSSIYLGVDYYELMIRNALGESLEAVEPQGSACAGQLLCAEKTGKITGITLPKVYTGEIGLDYNIGDRVRAFNVGPDRIGHLIVSGDSAQNALENLVQLNNMIQIVIEEN